MDDENNIYVISNEKPIKIIFDGIVTITSIENGKAELKIPFKHLSFKDEY